MHPLVFLQTIKDCMGRGRCTCVSKLVAKSVVTTPSRNNLLSLDHYKSVAGQFDKFYCFQHQNCANFIQHHLTITSNQQIVDIGGGTAEISLLIKKAMNVKPPIVCVDPSKEMLDIARKKGDVNVVQATAEEFFSSKTPRSLDIVLMVNCFHHFKNLNVIFSGLAKTMPDGEGACIIVFYPPETLPYFKAARDKYICPSAVKLQELLKALKLKLKIVSEHFPVELEKDQWYDYLRSRLDSGLGKFSDDAIEEGIFELEEKYKLDNTFKFDLVISGFIITKLKCEDIALAIASKNNSLTD